MQEVSAELQRQLQALGINPSDDVFRTGSEEFDHNGLSSPIPQEVRFMNAELRRCPVEGVGMVLAVFSGSGAVYEFVRTLRKCIFGKVKHAVRLQMTPNGSFVRTQLEVAIKVMSKVCCCMYPFILYNGMRSDDVFLLCVVATQVIIEEGNLQENPLVELAAQQYLSVPGHENVLTLVRHFASALWRHVWCVMLVDAWPYTDVFFVCRSSACTTLTSSTPCFRFATAANCFQ